MTSLRETVTAEQAAEMYSTDTSTIYSLAFDYHLLRVCVYTQFQPEFLEARKLRCRLRSTGLDLSSLYVDIPDREKRLERGSELQLLDVFDDEFTRRDYFDGVQWESPPPRLLYLNLRNALFGFDDGVVVPVSGQRLKPDDKLSFDWFETAEQDIFTIHSVDNGDDEISIQLRDFYFSKFELERVFSLLDGNGDESVSELELIIAAELELLLERREFKFGKKTSISGIVEYIQRFVEDAPGLKARNLHDQIKLALTLTDKK